MCMLAIESSCDEFSIAIVTEQKTVLFHETYSQIATHQQFGGVFPEIASREHVKQFGYLLEKAKAFIHKYQISALAVTIGPGLSGSLLIGIQIAKTLALYYDLPLIPVHHILGHIYSIENESTIIYPCMSLVISGGHTELILLKSADDVEYLGRTQDDAVGEVYDKIAKKLELGYPGGPILDRLAEQGQPTFHFTKPKLKNKLDFSFSGYKSAAMNHIYKLLPMTEEDICNLATSFQRAIVHDLEQKMCEALEMYDVKSVVLCGGVSANRDVRKMFQRLKKKYPDKKMFHPIPELCGDNALMIAQAAKHYKAIRDKDILLSLDCKPNLSIKEFLSEYN